MSASLVGSEMCIRDRSSNPRRGVRLGPKRARCRPRRAESRETRAKGQSPVSYTHLTLPTICSV
eukprot:12869519-Alexandrium_andersonii.AAC.1